MSDFKSAIEEIEYWERRDAEREEARKEREKEIASTSVSRLTEEVLLKAFGVESRAELEMRIQVSRDENDHVCVEVRFVAPHEYKSL